jgi:hypothetical protein
MTTQFDRIRLGRSRGITTTLVKEKTGQDCDVERYSESHHPFEHDEFSIEPVKAVFHNPPTLRPALRALSSGAPAAINAS